MSATIKDIAIMAQYIIKHNDYGFLNEFGYSILSQINAKGEKFVASPKQMAILLKHGVNPNAQTTPALAVSSVSMQSITRNGITLQIAQEGCKTYTPTADKDNVQSHRDIYEIIVISLYRSFCNAIGVKCIIPHDLLDNTAKYLPYAIPTDKDYGYYKDAPTNNGKRVIDKSILREIRLDYAILICSWLTEHKYQTASSLLDLRFSQIYSNYIMLSSFEMECIAKEYDWFIDAMLLEDYFYENHKNLYLASKKML